MRCSSRPSLVAIPLPVLCELVWVLRRLYGFTRADCMGAIEALMAKQSVVADRPAVAAGLQLLASAGDFADGSSPLAAVCWGAST